MSTREKISPARKLYWKLYSARHKSKKRKRGFAWLLNRALLLGMVVMLIRLWGRYQQEEKPVPRTEIELDEDLPPERSEAQRTSAQTESDGRSISAEPEQAEAGETGPEPAGDRQDDLKVIEGIGPKIESLLNSSGIKTYQELAESDESRLVEILEEAGLRMANPGTWPEQARLASAGDLEGLRQLQDHLKAGRRE